MKALISYIRKYTEVKPESIIEWHFYQEFGINESIYDINEKYGVYNGQVDFVVQIADYIEKNLFLTSNDELEIEILGDDLVDEKFENVFFDKLIIKYQKGIRHSGYVSLNDNFNEKTKRLNKVIIYLNDTDIKRNYNNTISTLIHELTHAWEDYNRNITNNLTLNDLISQKFGYKENIKQDNSDNFYKTLAKQIEYYLSKFEINAFLSELSVSLHKNRKKIHGYSDALNLFKKDDTWKTYETLYNTINNFSEIELSKFTMTYNSINKTSFTENKLLKKLNNRFEKVFRKVLTNVTKIYYDYYTKNKVNENLIVRPNIGYINHLEKLKFYKKPTWILNYL